MDDDVIEIIEINSDDDVIEINDINSDDDAIEIIDIKSDDDDSKEDDSNSDDDAIEIIDIKSDDDDSKEYESQVFDSEANDFNDSNFVNHLTHYVCCKCTIVTRDYIEMDDHLASFHPNLPILIFKMYRCDVCKRAFFRECALQLHLINHNGPAPVRCHWCKYCQYCQRHFPARNSTLAQRLGIVRLTNVSSATSGSVVVTAPTCVSSTPAI